MATGGLRAGALWPSVSSLIGQSRGTVTAIIGPRTSAPRLGLWAGAMDSTSFSWLVVEVSARYVSPTIVRGHAWRDDT